MATASWSDLIREADALMEKAWKAERLEDAHHYFLCAADKYDEGGHEHSAKLASRKADQCMRAMNLEW